MEIDIYQPCPCQSGKKIKFCCGKSIVGDLGRIVDLHKSGQLVAALEHADHTIARHGPADCLDALKIRILLELDETEKAAKCVEEFLTRSPTNPVGHQHRATLHALNEEFDEAIEALQDAMDFLPKNEIPIALAVSFRELGLALIEGGKFVTGVEHLFIASRLIGDQLSNELLGKFLGERGYPLVLKQPFSSLEPLNNSGLEWQGAYTHMVNAATLGKCREALQRARQLDARVPRQPLILKAITGLEISLGNLPSAVEAGERYCQIETIPFDDRAEMKALCLTLAEAPVSRSIDVMRVEFALNDIERFNERLLSHPQAVFATGDRVPDIRDEDDIPAAAVGALLDAPAMHGWEPGTPLPEQVPSIVARFTSFGKRTDRDARVYLVLPRNSQFEKWTGLFREIAGDTISPSGTEHVEGEIQLLEDALVHQWHFPPEAGWEARYEFLNRNVDRHVTDVWLNTPLIALDDRTPSEAARSGAPPLLTLAALIKLLDSSGGMESPLAPPVPVERLREACGVPAPELISDFDRLLTSSRLALCRLDPTSMTDRSLAMALYLAGSCGAVRVMRKAISELLGRPENMEEIAGHDTLLTRLAGLTSDVREALSYLEKAKKIAAENGRSQSDIYLTELRLRIDRGVLQGTRELLHEIETRFADDREMQIRTMMVLRQYGLMRGDEEASRLEAEEPVGAVTGESGLWVPESAQPARKNAGDSGLWLPE
jgi:tetratricopeptide (TPR) repeat protein